MEVAVSGWLRGLVALEPFYITILDSDLNKTYLIKIMQRIIKFIIILTMHLMEQILKSS